MRNIFIDIDGTIIDHSEHKIHENTLKALKELSKDNILWLCTGRVYESAKIDIGFDIDNYICSLGSMIYRNGEMIYERPFSKEEIEEVLLATDAYGISVTYECAKHAYCSKMAMERTKDRRPMPFETHRDYWQKMSLYDGSKVYKLMIETGDDNVENYERFIKEMSDRYEFCASTNKKLHLSEVSPKSVSKGNAIEVLSKMGLFKMEETLCIGDSPNDISMFEVCAYSIAMGQGYDYVKERADYVTDDVSNDGFYKAFKHLGLIK